MREGRELGGVEDLVGVGVADAGEDAGVGEGALEGAVLGGEGLLEGFGGEGEDVEAAGVEVGEGGFALDEVEGGAALGAGFGEDEGAVGEVEGGEVVAAAELGWRSRFAVELASPVEAAGDHEVEDEEEVVRRKTKTMRLPMRRRARTVCLRWR